MKTTEEIQNQIDELTRLVDSLKKDKTLQNEKISKLEKVLIEHTHQGDDGSKQFDRDIDLLAGQTFGAGKVAGFTGLSIGETTYAIILTGRDETAADGIGNSQITLQHLHATDGVENQSFFFGFRGPIYSDFKARITSAGTTLNQNQYKWKEDELVGAYVIVKNSSTDDEFDAFPIASNTSSTLTITGAWTFSGSNQTATIFVPIYLGSADYPWRRIYTTDGTAGGIRFGFGDTAGGQNGLLYMDATGDLYWRNKTGTSTKLN